MRILSRNKHLIVTTLLFLSLVAFKIFSSQHPEKPEPKETAEQKIYKMLEKENISHQQMQKFAGHDYLVIEQSCSYSRAQEICKKLGGYLVTITNREENRFISSLLKADRHYWIGLTSSQQNPKLFKWEYRRSIFI